MRNSRTRNPTECSHIHMNMLAHTCTVHVPTYTYNVHTHQEESQLKLDYSAKLLLHGRILLLFCATGTYMYMYPPLQTFMYMYMYIKIFNKVTHYFFSPNFTFFDSSWSTPFCRPILSKRFWTNTKGKQIPRPSSVHATGTLVEWNLHKMQYHIL